MAPVAQLDRALPSEGRGQGFESLRVRHTVWFEPDPPKMNVFSLLAGFTGKICVFFALHFAENRRKILGNPPFLLSKGAVISRK